MRLGGILVGSTAALWCVGVGLAAAGPAPAGGMRPQARQVRTETPQDAAAVELFERSVRPVLAEHCYSCHGPRVQQAGLRLDSRAAMLAGGAARRPVIAPGDPAASLLLRVLQHDGPVKMPPGRKLPAEALDALAQWVRMGAPWPQTQARPVAEGGHWAFRPVRKPAVPTPRNRAWVKSPVDAFVLARLEARGLAPARSADRRTLIRRAYFDLIGLPPRAEEIEAFVADRSPTAFTTVVDRLLADPRYGERWGRYWLDVARYADTKGYVFQEERRYPHAYTYRDWVVRALNEDLPYDQFLVQQIAADRLDLGEDRRPLAAMGFLTLGRRFLNNTADITDDRIDTVFRGTQALTVACARCHDHKFDPIPTADYYSLYGVFASSSEPKEGPLLEAPQRTAAYAAFEKQLKTLEEELQRFLQSKHGEVLARARGKIAESLLAAHEADRPGANAAAIAQKHDVPVELVRRWQAFLKETAKGSHPIFAPWHAFAALPDAEFAARAPAVSAGLGSGSGTTKLLNPRVAQAFGAGPPASLQDVARRLAGVLAAPGGDEQLEHALDSIGGPLNIPVDQVEQFFDRADRNKSREIRARLDRFKATSPAAPARAMVLVDNPTPMNPRIFVRGNPNNQGEAVPRQFLAVLSPSERRPFQHGSGRLELAQAIASRENPLTARVMVNRVWMWHFGEGLVRTPSDFGIRSDPPTHPELLDYLASRFMEDGWSLKKLHRLMMLSSTYQQASDGSEANALADPENTLLWRMNRRRLDFEAMRDSLLYAAGRLDASVGGPSVDLVKAPFTTRRSVYGFIDRQNLPNLFRTFDLASPDTTSPQRYQTTVPQQALFLMNSPFVLEQARHLAARSEVARAADAPERVRQLYRVVYGRAPSAQELELGLRYLKAAGAAGVETPARAPDVWQYGYGAVDEPAGRVARFQPLSHFTGSAYQGGPDLPDQKTGWCILTASGGHAGSDQARVTIRRWVAPAGGTVTITGTVGHGTDQGDGIRARIVSSRAGVLGSWTAANSRVDAVVMKTEVQWGDTLDFVVDCRSGPNHDTFTWAPVVRYLQPPHGGAAAEWSAAAGFGGPREAAAAGLGPLEKYAQALLLANEFFFVD